MKSFLVLLFDLRYITPNDLPIFNMFGKKITINNIYEWFYNRFFSTFIRSERLNVTTSQITKSDIKKISTCLDEQPIQNNRAIISIYEKNLIFNENESRVSQNFIQDDKYKIQTCVSSSSIKILIKAESIEPKSSFSINTGIVIKINSKEHVLIPQSMTSNMDPDMIPSITVRDGDTRGPIMVNGTTLSGNLGTITVVFRAYKALRLPEFVENSDKFLKSKDFLDENRYTVIITKTIAYDNIDLNKNGRYVIINSETNDSIQLPLVKKKHLLFLSSRNREWCNSGCVTLAGALSKSEYIKPILTSNAVQPLCVTLLDGKVLMKPNIKHQIDEDYYTYGYDLNGAFMEDFDYKKVKKNMGYLKRNLKMIQFIFSKYDSSKIKYSFADYALATGYTNSYLITDHQIEAISKMGLEILEKPDNTYVGNEVYKKTFQNMYNLINLLNKDIFDEEQHNLISMIINTDEFNYEKWCQMRDD